MKKDSAKISVTEEANESVSTIAERAGKIREFVFKSLLDSYKEEYKEIADRIRSIETKAQGTIAVAGIFIGAGFVFLRDSSTSLTPTEKVILVLSILFFVTSIVFSVLVLKIKEMGLPAAGVTIEKSYLDFLAISNHEEVLTRLDGLINQQSLASGEVRTHNRKVLESKATNLLTAQWILIVGIISIALIVILRTI